MWRLAPVLVLTAAAVSTAADAPPSVSGSWIQILRDVGFPAAVATYVLVRLENVVNAQTAAIHALREAVGRLLEREEDRDRRPASRP